MTGLKDGLDYIKRLWTHSQSDEQADWHRVAQVQEEYRRAWWGCRSSFWTGILYMRGGWCSIVLWWASYSDDLENIPLCRCSFYGYHSGCSSYQRDYQCNNKYLDTHHYCRTSESKRMRFFGRDIDCLERNLCSNCERSTGEDSFGRSLWIYKRDLQSILVLSRCTIGYGCNQAALSSDWCQIGKKEYSGNKKVKAEAWACDDSRRQWFKNLPSCTFRNIQYIETSWQTMRSRASGFWWTWKWSILYIAAIEGGSSSCDCEGLTASTLS